MATATPPGAEQWEPPAEFEEYRLVKPIGAGRTGRVWLAFDTLLERHVAVKFIPALDSASLARFLVEARAAARIQHPNVVALFRVGQLENRPFLVSEFVRGSSLDRVKKPLEPALARRILVDLTRGLAAAHRMGVLHRDIKPGNAVVAESGEAKLLDFGLAKIQGRADGPPSGAGGAEERLELPDLSHANLFGTPYYMSPEAWRAEDATPRSDLYSLGAVAYELVAGRAPFRGVPLAELPNAIDTRPPPPLSGVDARLGALILRCLERDPRARFASAADLLDELLALEREPGAAVVPGGNPYRGLRAFEAEHRALFFGRGREIRAVVERLRTEPFVLVTGDSGAGKSSLCLAGVLPDVAGGALGDGREWRYVRAVPGPRPLSSIASALAPVLGIDDPSAEALLATPGDDAARAISAKLGRGAGLVLYVDQLEELVTLSGPEEAATVSRALASLASGLPALKLLATVRSDFLSRLSAVPALGDGVSRALHLLPPLSPAGIREAIVGPARLKGVRFESDEMVSELVRSTASAGGGLPLLQFALAELWDARDRQAAVIARAALEAIGGVNGALARHADGILSSMLEEERLAARRLLLRLVTVDDTRARRSEAELVVGDQSRRALERLVRGRIVVARESEEGTAYEIAHEALLRGWGTLARWLTEESERRELAARLTASAREWDRGGRKPDTLWSSRLVREAQVLDPESLTPVERSFLAESRSSARRGRVTVLAIAVAIVALLAGSLTWMRIDQRNEQRTQIGARMEEARRAFDAARAARSAAETEEREAWALFDAAKLAQAEAAWGDALEATARERQAWSEAGDAYERLLSLANNDPGVRGAFGDFLVARAMAAEDRGERALRDLLVQRLRQYDPTGKRAATLEAPARLAIEAPPGATLSLFRWTADARGRMKKERVELATELRPGSYQLEVAAAGRAPATMPVLLARGESVSLSIDPPPSDAVPPGYVWIPAGRFLFGTSADEGLREYYKTAPIHRAETGAYLIADHETTWGEWIEYLESLPPAERAKRTPSTAATGFHGTLSLVREGEGWRLTMQPAAVRLSAKEGEPIRYPVRKARAEQDWRRMPVAGVSVEDARAYAAWLAKSGRVPGARLCTEREWERAARGADDREYPHGNRLAPDEANFDRTYGQVPESFGPDEVGAHPASASPFGVHDLSGNVWEWVDSSLEPGTAIARGGSYYFSASTARVVNREKPEQTLRDLTVGFRVCADAEK